MKKVFSLVAFLLAALMLLASCNFNTPQSTTPEQTIPEQTTPEQTTPEQTTPEQTTPEQTTPEQTTPEQTTPEQTTPEQTTPEQTTPEQTTPEQTTPEQTTPEQTPPETPPTPVATPKKILAIGNSFSVDAMQHLAEILVGEGYTDFVLGNLYIGGCSIDGHKARIDSGAADYTFYTNTGTGWKSVKASISTGLTYTDWDVITVQQVSGLSGIPDSFGNLQYVIDYAKSKVTNPDVQIYWHMTWAYQANASHSDFSRYNKNQMTMYNAIVSAVQEKILTNTSIDGILPSGTAIQNLRTSYIGDTLTRDGYHLSNDIGRYTAALLWYRVLMGADLTDLTTVPASYPGIAQHLPAIKEAVDNAAKTPFVVTEATVTGPVGSEVLESLLEMTEDDAAYLEKRGLNPDDYEVLDLRLTFWAYYYSTNQATAKLLPNEGNSSQYFATGLFTPQTLPVGSIIRVKEGYKYRLEGWQKTGTKNSLTRLNNSTADMVIDASLYTKYNFVAFNVSHASGGGTVDYADAWGFRIYTPKQKAPDLSMTEADRAYLEDLGLDPDNFEKLDLDYTQFAYYLSTDASAGTVYSAESRTDNNLINFLATRLISKEEMPVGSVIRVDSGYQFRPERFVTPEVAADKRGDNTFVGCIVDEAWWGNYQHVGFNISIKGASTTFVATPETGTHFVIYVPKA